MDVRDNRDIDDVIILGSGMSILDLSDEQKKYINKCKIVIALNKFMMFYKKSGIIPTHVFFTEIRPTSYVFLFYIFKICTQDKLKGLTWVLHRSASKYVYKNYRDLIRNFLIVPKAIKYLFKLKKIPRRSKVHYIRTSNWLEGNDWSKSINEPLFHYTSSLTCIFNYISIMHPNKTIFLVGADLNSKKYFFQEELEKLGLVDSQDWSVEIVKEKGMHLSAIPNQGKTIFDKLPFILYKLSESGNVLYSINPDSLLVTAGNIEYSNFKELG